MNSDIQTPHIKHQSIYIVIALVAGILVGELLNLSLHNGSTPSPILNQILSLFSALTDIFLRLIKMIIAPLVFSTLVVGMAKMGNVHTVGRIGIKAMLWFFSASFFSLLLGMLLVNIFEPGHTLHIALPVIGTTTGLSNVQPTIANLVGHLFPKSIVDAMATNDILQIVVFSMFFGFSCAAIGDFAKPVVVLLDSLTHIMLKMTGYIMHYAPVAIFASMASVVSLQGIAVLLAYGRFIGEFYLGLFLLCTVLTCAGYVFLKGRVFSLLRHIREPMLIAFGTASSESAYPKLLQQLERFGCDEKVCGLVLPLGYSFNLDGSMMYMTFSVLFIAQAYGIDIALNDQFFMLLVLLFTSKGVAGVPRASLIVIAATLNQFNIPEAGLLLLLGIDQILDMGRSATNVFGNSIAASLVSKWEKSLR